MCLIFYSVVCVCRQEFCGPTPSSTLNDDYLIEEVVTPGYPDSYTTDRQCTFVIAVDVNRPCTVTIVGTVEDCSTPLYGTLPGTVETLLEKTSTCSSSNGSNQLTTTFKYTGSEDDVKIATILIHLFSGSGNGFSILILCK